MDLSERLAGEGHLAGPLSCRHPWELARLCVLDGMFRQCLLATGDRPANVLDFGCGDGFVTRSLAGEYPRHRFTGVDCAMNPPLAAALESSVGRGNARFVSSLDAVNTEGGAFDILLLMDVLEHCPDDRRELARVLAHACLSPRVTVIATAPAFPGLFSSHDRLLGHHRRYTRSGLVGLLEDSGLRVEESGHLFGSLLPLRALRVWMERKRLVAPIRGTSVGNWRGTAGWSQFLRSVLSLDCRLLRAMARMNVYLAGLSCYAISRKRS